MITDLALADRSRRRHSHCALVVVLALASRGSVGDAAAPPSPTPEKLVADFLGSLGADRLRGSFQIEYSSVHKPLGNKVDYTYRVDPPRVRLDCTLYDLNPAVPPDIIVEIWNGRSQIRARRIQGRDSDILVQRNGYESENPFHIYFLEHLGVPRTPTQIADAELGKAHWLATTVSARNGYVVTREDRAEPVGGRSCCVVAKGKEDRLWFEDRDPCRLLRREVWVRDPFLHKQVLRYSDYQGNGLPGKIVRTRYEPTKEIGDSSNVQYEDFFNLKSFATKSFSGSDFVYEVPQNADVFDMDTAIRYVVASPSDDPFDDLIHKSQVRPTPGFAPVLLINVILLGAILVGLGFWLRPRLVRDTLGDPGDGSAVR